MPNLQHTVITLSRQMGSGGTYLGYLLAKKLGFRYIDREILREAARSMGTDTKWLEHHDERSSGLLAAILRSFTVGSPETAFMPPVQRPVYEKDLFAVESRIMNDLADRYAVVIIGRGGFHVLKNRPEVLRVFVHAPLEFRIKRLMKVRRNSDIKQARADIEKSDQRRARFIKDMTGSGWTDALNYHLCIDSSKVDFESSVEMIMRLAKGWNFSSQ